jgi:c-di-GMP-binding flagellar brake protein YcgR
MKQKGHKERRKFRRVSILQDLFFGDRLLHPLETISENGLFIATPDVFMKGSVLDLKFRLYRSEKPIVVKAEVRYAMEGRGMGVRFLDLKPEDRKRIKKFIQKF